MRTSKLELSLEELKVETTPLDPEGLAPVYSYTWYPSMALETVRTCGESACWA
jgi:hypothetical protein